MQATTLRRLAVNVNEEWPLHTDVSRSGRASVQLNGYRIGCRSKKILWEFRSPNRRISARLSRTNRAISNHLRIRLLPRTGGARIAYNVMPRP
jgi:hypothetical protein